MLCFRNLSQNEAPQKTVEQPCPEEEITPKVNTAAPNTPYVHFVPTWESITFPFKYYCYSPISFFDYAGKDRNLADTEQYFDLQSLLRTCQLSLAAVPV